MRFAALASLLATLVACSHAPIVDGAHFGVVTQAKTLFTSAFVIPTRGDAAILVDAGFDKKARPLIDALASMGLEPADVHTILLTHGHTDHLRGLDEFPNARVLALGDEAVLLAEAGVKLTESLTDAQTLVIDGVQVEVFAVPGHTRGNAVYLIAGVLVTGDSAMLYRDGSVRPVADRWSDDPQQAQASLDALRDRLRTRQAEIRAVTFSHSGGTTDASTFFD